MYTVFPYFIRFFFSKNRIKILLDLVISWFELLLKLVIIFITVLFKNRIKVITKFRKNFKNFNTVFWIDSFRRIEHPYYIVNIVTWETVQYWKTNSSLLKNNSSLLKHFWYKKKNLCYIVNIATWKTIQYRRTNSSLLQKMLSYWKNSLLLKKSLCYRKKCFAVEKNIFAIEKLSLLSKYLWHKKNLRYIVNIVIKLGAYLHSEVYFCPHSRCQILWERCLFLMAYVSLWISGSMTPKCSEHKTEVSVGRQSVLLSFSIQTSKSFESFIGNLQTKW